MRSYALLLCLLVLLAACGSDGPTAPGLLVTRDLRDYLPEGVAAPADADTQRYQQEVEVSNARVRIEWTAFTNGDDAYILSATFTLVETQSGMTINAGALGEPINMGDEDEINMGLPIVVTWSIGSGAGLTGGSATGTITADGSWLPDVTTP